MPSHVCRACRSQTTTGRIGIGSSPVPLACADRCLWYRGCRRARAVTAGTEGAEHGGRGRADRAWRSATQARRGARGSACGASCDALGVPRHGGRGLGHRRQRLEGQDVGLGGAPDPVADATLVEPLRAELRAAEVSGAGQRHGRQGRGLDDDVHFAATLDGALGAREAAVVGLQAPQPGGRPSAHAAAGFQQGQGLQCEPVGIVVVACSLGLGVDLGAERVGVTALGDGPGDVRVEGGGRCGPVAVGARAGGGEAAVSDALLEEVVHVLRQDLGVDLEHPLHVGELEQAEGGQRLLAGARAPGLERAGVDLVAARDVVARLQDLLPVHPQLPAAA